ncbi:ABC transporter permease [Christensenella intestinihominis]|uniref:ABC transporter permease n=1 Tax=Christensenella intestinihominis TaxID=1851429 RepID=UPI00082C1FF3|nr:ABC transporter permease [Christensenella intestinihominis]
MNTNRLMMKSLDVKSFLKRNLMLVIFLITIIIMFATTPSFRRFSNIVGLFNQICIYGVAAVGMTFAIINGEFDMSMGGVVSLASLMSAYVMKYMDQANPVVAILLGLAVGVVVGLVNGLLVTKLKINTFVVTLSTMVISYGVAQTFCDALGVPSSITYNNDLLYNMGNGSIGGIPYFVWFFLVMVIVGEFILRKTRFGRNVFAVGGNAEVCRASGININKNKMLVFLVCGISASVAGIMMSAKMMTGSPAYAEDLPLTAISAVVLGGTSMAGGSGSVVRTLLGLLILSLITNIFNLLEINIYVQNMVKGLIIVGTVTISNYLRYYRQS